MLFNFFSDCFKTDYYFLNHLSILLLIIVMIVIFVQLFEFFAFLKIEMYADKIFFKYTSNLDSFS